MMLAWRAAGVLWQFSGVLVWGAPSGGGAPTVLTGGITLTAPARTRRFGDQARVRAFRSPGQARRFVAPERDRP